jgi:1-acyl-sn-glycerol-3-phosphate acyltransferase
MLLQAPLSRGSQLITASDAWYWLGRPAVDLYARLMLQTDVVWQAPLPAGPKIIAANHPTTSDPFFLLTLLPEPVSVLITASAFESPLLGAYLRQAGHVPAIRNSRGATPEALKRQIEAGRNVLIFPEGALSPARGRFHPAHTGVARLALTSGAPVVPVGIGLLHERVRIVETEEDGKPVVGKFYLQGPYAMTVGEPLWLAGDVEDRACVHAAAEQIMQRIIGLSRESSLRLHRAPAFEMGHLPHLARLATAN